MRNLLRTEIMRNEQNRSRVRCNFGVPKLREKFIGRADDDDDIVATTRGCISQN